MLTKIKVKVCNAVKIYKNPKIINNITEAKY